MNEAVSPKPGAPHLFSALIALAIPIVILGGGAAVAKYLELKTIAATAPRDLFIKNQGLALQRAAAHSPHVLLLYGSSELIDKRPEMAAEHFANAPTGFQICPVGKPGASPLTMLQKIAAVGPALRHGKIAISISPSFFFRHEENPSLYAGNFSLWAANAMVFRTTLDLELKREIARRMLRFPDTLAKSVLLQLAVNKLASERPIDHMIFVVIWPVGYLQTAILDLQDHFEALIYILSGERTISRRELREIFAPGEAAAREAEGNAHDRAVGSLVKLGPAGFRNRIEGATTWNDLELLFRVLQRFRIHALVLSMPFDGIFYNANGISRSDRQFYYDKMRSLTARYGIELEEFEDQDGDPFFQVPRSEHPTNDGWVCYDKALDDFFHRTE